MGHVMWAIQPTAWYRRWACLTMVPIMVPIQAAWWRLRGFRVTSPCQGVPMISGKGMWLTRIRLSSKFYAKSGMRTWGMIWFAPWKLWNITGWWLLPNWMESHKKHVPNHQPDYECIAIHVTTLPHVLIHLRFHFLDQVEIWQVVYAGGYPDNVETPNYRIVG